MVHKDNIEQSYGDKMCPLINIVRNPGPFYEGDNKCPIINVVENPGTGDNSGNMYHLISIVANLDEFYL